MNETHHFLLKKKKKILNWFSKQAHMHSRSAGAESSIRDCLAQKKNNKDTNIQSRILCTLWIIIPYSVFDFSC